MLPDVAAPVKTAATQFGVPDAVRFGQPSLPDPISKPKQNVLKTAENLVNNNTTIKVLGGFMETGAKIAIGIGDTILGVTEVDRQRQRNAESFFNNVSSKNYKTRGELGSSTDPGRLAGDPSVDLFAGMNKVSAKGNLEKAGAKRIDTRRATIARKGIKSASNPNGVSQEFVNNTNNMEKELNDMRRHNNNENIKSAKKKGVDTSKLNPNEMRNVAETGDPGGDRGGKIVCTMMNESYGFGSFRNKIWMKFHGNIAPEYQKGYHKLFLPLVNYAKQKGITNKIIKNILEHIAVHSTIDMRQTLRGKRHTLGRLYRKIILPLCYWAGKK